jgi:RNA polymerase sigma factor (sigma-70 family)
VTFSSLDTDAERLLRELAPQVLVAVMRRFGDFAECEDAVQEALIAAAAQWARDGLPDNPRGWLVHVATRRMIDHVRSEISRRSREAATAGEILVAVGPADCCGPDPDDSLALLFMCCHPALSPSSAIALTLRAVGGLTTVEIAKAFLVPESTMAQRISRAFPNADWNTPQKGTDHYLDNVLGLRSDENGIVWIVDMGFRAKITPKLVGWNTRTDKLERIYYMPVPITRSGSQPQDIVIDQKNRKFYIADEDIGPGGDGSHAAIIIIDMDTGRARRVLDGGKSTVPENVPITVYVSASQISAAAMFNGGKAENKTPYLIYRFKPIAAGYVSR